MVYTNYHRELENKYIKIPYQNIIYNDGDMIEWWEMPDVNMVSIHHADFEKEDIVYIEINHLLKLTSDVIQQYIKAGN